MNKSGGIDMSLTNKKFEDLKPEQQKAIKAAGRKLMTGMFLSGINFGGLLFFSNLVLIMAHVAIFHSTFLLFVLSVAVDIYLLRMMGQTNREKAEEFRTTVKKILNAEQ
jgi:hypothetical protein